MRKGVKILEATACNTIEAAISRTAFCKLYSIECHDNG